MKGGAKFWLQVLTDLQNRWCKRYFNTHNVDVLKGFPEAINLCSKY